MKKPNVGDRVTVALYIEDMRFPDLPQQGRVLGVYDSLISSEPNGNWDPWGEMAMLQSEVDEATGKKGEWYIVFEPIPDQPGETWSAASYEVVDVASA